MVEESDSDIQGEEVLEVTDTITEITSETLPHELVVDILSRLPTIYLWPLRFMCKSWFELITSDTHFAKLAFDRSVQLKSNPISVIAWGEKSCYNSSTKRADLAVYLATDHTECDKAMQLVLPFLSHEQNPSCCVVYGICNGMLCLWDADKDEVYIWNPLTNDHVTIPCPTNPRKSSNRRTRRLYTGFGFGFLESANEYKIIRLSVRRYLLGRRGYRTVLSVYTLGIDSAWRTVRKDIPYLISFDGVLCPQTDGHLYWAATVDGEIYPRAVLAFDLSNELLYEIMCLPIDFTSRAETCVQELGGSLCVIRAIIQKYVDIYEFQLSGDEEACCSWQCTIGRPEVDGDFSVLIPLGIVADSGDIIVLNKPKGLMLYNRFTKAINHLKTFGFPIENAHTFVGSLISPRAISGTGHFGT